MTTSKRFPHTSPQASAQLPGTRPLAAFTPQALPQHWGAGGRRSHLAPPGGPVPSSAEPFKARGNRAPPLSPPAAPHGTAVARAPARPPPVPPSRAPPRLALSPGSPWQPPARSQLEREAAERGELLPGPRSPQRPAPHLGPPRLPAPGRWPRPPLHCSCRHATPHPPPPLSADGSPHPGPPSHWRCPPVTPRRDRPAPGACW